MKGILPLVYTESKSKQAQSIQLKATPVAQWLQYGASIAKVKGPIPGDWTYSQKQNV